MSDPYKYIFISYAYEDKEIAKKVATILTSIGFSVWIDLEKLQPGYKWDKFIKEAINGATGALFLISNTSLEKDGYVQTELELLLERQATRDDSEIFLLPVIIEDCDFINSKLSHLQWIDFRPPFHERIGGFTQSITNSYLKLLESHERAGDRINVAEKKQEEIERQNYNEKTATADEKPYVFAKGTSSRFFTPDELDIYCNKITGESFIFHGKEIDKNINNLTYSHHDHSVIVQMQDGKKYDLGVKIQWLIRPYFSKVDTVQIVRTKDGEAIDGIHVPLKKRGRFLGVGLKQWLRLAEAHSKGYLKLGTTNFDPTKKNEDK